MGPLERPRFLSRRHVSFVVVVHKRLVDDISVLDPIHDPMSLFVLSTPGTSQSKDQIGSCQVIFILHSMYKLKFERLSVLKFFIFLL